MEHLLKKNKVELLNGFGKILDKNGQLRNVEVKDKDGKVVNVSGKNIIIATGARARSLPNIEPDGNAIWTYREAMVPNDLPKSLLIIGSGAIGVEFASFYNDMGVDVTLVEVLDRILPVEDHEISTFAQKTFVKQGIKIKTSSKVLGLKKDTTGIDVSMDTNGVVDKLKVDKVILAVGIIAALQSTAAAFLMTSGSIITRDLYKTYVNKNITWKNELIAVRLITMLIFLASLKTAVFRPAKDKLHPALLIIGSGNL